MCLWQLCAGDINGKLRCSSVKLERAFFVTENNKPTNVLATRSEPDAGFVEESGTNPPKASSENGTSSGPQSQVLCGRPVATGFEGPGLPAGGLLPRLCGQLSVPTADGVGCPCAAVLRLEGPARPDGVCAQCAERSVPELPGQDQAIRLLGLPDPREGRAGRRQVPAPRQVLRPSVERFSGARARLYSGGSERWIRPSRQDDPLAGSYHCTAHQSGNLVQYPIHQTTQPFASHRSVRQRLPARESPPPLSVLYASLARRTNYLQPTLPRTGRHGRNPPPDRAHAVHGDGSRAARAGRAVLRPKTKSTQLLQRTQDSEARVLLVSLRLPSPTSSATDRSSGSAKLRASVRLCCRTYTSSGCGAAAGSAKVLPSGGQRGQKVPQGFPPVAD